MLEWEPPRPHERALTLENYAIDFVSAAVEQVAEETGEPDVSVVGYCFGGVLSLLWAALEGEGRLANLATFTTPVDFRHMDLFQAWSDRRFFDVDRLVDTLGNVPGEMLYGAFYMLRPAAQTAQNVRLYDNLWDDAYVKSVRMSSAGTTTPCRWRGNISATTKALMWDNRLLDGSLDVGGRRVDLSRIDAPFLHLAAEHDHIVPTAALAVTRHDRQPRQARSGAEGRPRQPRRQTNAAKRMWPTLAGWLAARSV
ncbi:alpha/beta fold hydrolase [Sphingomonas sp. MMS24-JH45]